jgi:hypothetical protein
LNNEKEELPINGIISPYRDYDTIFLLQYLFILYHNSFLFTVVW